MTTHDTSAHTGHAQRIDGFLLTRHWRDKWRDNHHSGKGDSVGGVNLEFWASTERGPLKLCVPGESAVCFVDRHRQFENTVLSNVTRKAVNLKLLDGGEVDALYFHHQRDLADAHRQGLALYESDIKPSDRFLMERFVNAGFSAEGHIQQRSGFLEMVHPRLAPAVVNPALKPLSLDIETRANSHQLYSIGASTPERSAVFMLDESLSATATQQRKLQRQNTQQNMPYTLMLLPSVEELLAHFFQWLAQEDPDVIIGWNIVNFDLAFLHQVCTDLNVPFAMARGSEQATVLQPSQFGSNKTNGPRIARIPGRPVLDGIDLLRAGFWSFESFALDNVASELLGIRKLITGDTDKVAEINRLFREDKGQLADYNLLDCVLVLDIFKKADLLPFAIQRAAITGLAIDRMGGSVAAFDHLYLPRLHRSGYVAPNVIGRDTENSSPGGYVMDSQPGLYENVLVLDFKSLYPSIIRTFLIDPLGLALHGRYQRHANEQSQTNPRIQAQIDEKNDTIRPPGSDTDRFVPGFNDAAFSRQHHILPTLIEDLWTQRDQAKQVNDRALSQAIKIIMNSFYGVLGSSGCRFHKQQLASSITRRGHEIITRTRDFVQTHGYQVIYGDTDSVFVLLGPGIDEDAANTIGKELTVSLNTWWNQTLMDEFQISSKLEVEYETHYLKFLMPTVRGLNTGSKKRYAGMIRDKNATKESRQKENAYQIIFKGLEAVRTDWTPLARNFQRELYRRIFLNEPYEQFVRDTATALTDGRLDSELIYRKRIRRKLSDYQKNVPPHVQAARKQAKSGHWVSYVITRNGPEPIDNMPSLPNYEHYLEKQLAPAADGILYFLDTSFQTINDSQMRMF